MSRRVMTIRCDNTEEYEKLASMLSAIGYRWPSGENPKEWNPYRRIDTKCYINLYSDYIIRYDDTDNYMDYISVETYRIKEGTNMDKFTKSDLEDGMIVRVRGGYYYMYFKKFNKLLRYYACWDMKEFNDDLTNTVSSDSDIVAVYVPSNLTSFNFDSQIHSSDMIWERPEEVVMTISEIEEKLGITNLKIIKE